MHVYFDIIIVQRGHICQWRQRIWSDLSLRMDGFPQAIQTPNEKR